MISSYRTKIAAGVLGFVETNFAPVCPKGSREAPPLTCGKKMSHIVSVFFGRKLAHVRSGVLQIHFKMCVEILDLISGGKKATPI